MKTAEQYEADSIHKHYERVLILTDDNGEGLSYMDNALKVASGMAFEIFENEIALNGPEEMSATANAIEVVIASLWNYSREDESVYFFADMVARMVCGRRTPIDLASLREFSHFLLALRRWVNEQAEHSRNLRRAALRK